MPVVSEPDEEIRVTKKQRTEPLNFTLLCPDIEEEENDPAANFKETIIEELKRYRSIKCINTDERSCPLQFYKIHQHILPNLSSISELVFCTTASSVPSECVFSGAGRLIDKSRSRLRPELAEDLLFLNRNQI